ncbi:HlyD family secretion protein [uncultured Acinetobacter sp.]|uniref:HlyD family secretion protein n=1 Tax=uncultured Acinetobacter sp. TaxID=165433 RepID=UPI00374825AA
MPTDQSSSDTEHPVPSASESATTTGPQQKQTPHGPKRAVKIIGLIILLLIIGLIIYGLWKAYQPRSVALQGRVEAETLYVTTKVPSRIAEIFVEEGQNIKKGQALARLVSPEIEAKKQQAQAALQSALALQSTAERGSQEENIDTLYANWQSVKAQAELAETTYRRGETLYKEGVISRQRRDEMFAAQRSARALSEAAYQQYARAKRGSTPQQKSMADAQVDIARAALGEAESLETETKLYSPINGTVSKIYGKPSELVAAAVPVVSLLEDDERWVSLNVREDQYRSVYQQKTLQGYVPALDKKINFNIQHIDAEGEFATIKTTRQTGGYDIRSFKLHLKSTEAAADLKVGMSVIFDVVEAN